MLTVTELTDMLKTSDEALWQSETGLKLVLSVLSHLESNRHINVSALRSAELSVWRQGREHVNCINVVLCWFITCEKLTTTLMMFTGFSLSFLSSNHVLIFTEGRKRRSDGLLPAQVLNPSLFTSPLSTLLGENKEVLRESKHYSLLLQSFWGQVNSSDIMQTLNCH